MMRAITILTLMIALAMAGAHVQAVEPAQAPTELSALDRFAFLGREVGYIPSERFLQFLGNAEAGVKEPGLLEGRGPVAILLLVFAGGLALNLTPCVLPMIPINLAIIGAGAKSGSRGRGFLLGGTYGMAMALVYGAIGLVVILTASSFGTLNASPWFNVAIAALFIVLGLAMFDRLTIDFSRVSNRFGGGNGGRGSFALAFGMGAIAALLAGACVAPVVLQVVLFSSDLYSRGTPIALALPFLLGVGMAVPWPIAGAGLAALPRPGQWMVHVKHAFGAIILVTAAYYGYEAYTLFRSSHVTAAAQTTVKDGWYHSLPAALSVAQAEGKPLFIDMWATWCKACYVMEETTFRDDAVRASLDGYVKVKFQAEDPETQPAKALMERWDTIGLPTYIILQPR